MPTTENGAKQPQAECLIPIKMHNLRETHFSVLDKRARYLWTSRDPLNETDILGLSTAELYDESCRDQFRQRMSECVVAGATQSYTANASLYHDGEVGPKRNLKVTLLPIDYGAASVVSICTRLPDNYHEFGSDDFAMLRLMADDMGLREIATAMHRSESAIDSRVKSLKQKLGCKTIGGLVAAALKHALI